MFEMLVGTLPFTSKDRKQTMNQILRAKLRMPEFLSTEAQSLLRALFKRNPANRLGAGPLAVNEIKYHAFFASINWNKLYHKEINPPFQPTVHADEAYYFDREFTSRTPKDSPGIPISANNGTDLFRGFSFVAPILLNDSVQIKSTTSSDTITSSTISDNNKRNKTDSNNNNMSTNKKLIQIIDNLLKISLIKIDPFENEYLIKEKINSGSYSTCHRCIHKKTAIEYAVKLMNIEQRDPLEEIEILLRHSHHPNIVSVRDIYLNESNLFLVLEYCRGGELLDKIIAKTFLTEKEAALILKVLTQTVDYLHRNGVVHRDLKPSNILYVDPSNEKPESLRIIDFGFAKQLRDENGLLMTPCYTAHYAAPEVLKRQGYDAACDIWSLGCILFIMLSGRPPFIINQDATTESILSKISESRINLEDGNWKLVSNEAKDLLSKMLNLDPRQRINAQGILKHSWIVRADSLPDFKLSLNDPASVKDAIAASYKVFNPERFINDKLINLSPVVQSGIAKRRANKINSNT
jgi:ribosomal protein S6 kinase alpha-1/2/3/6